MTDATYHIDTTLTELAELDAQRTPGPLSHKQDSNGSNYADIFGCDGDLVAAHVEFADAALIVAAVNALGPLLDACEERDALARGAQVLRETPPEVLALGDELLPDDEAKSLLESLEYSQGYADAGHHDQRIIDDLVRERDNLAARLREAEAERDKLSRQVVGQPPHYRSLSSLMEDHCGALKRRISELERENARLHAKIDKSALAVREGLSDLLDERDKEVARLTAENARLREVEALLELEKRADSYREQQEDRATRLRESGGG